MQEDGVNRFNQPQELQSEIRKAAIEAKPPRRSLPALINPTASICSSRLMSRYNNTIPPDMPALHLEVTWRCWWSAAAACTHTWKPFPWCTVWSINHQSIYQSVCLMAAYPAQQLQNLRFWGFCKGSAHQHKSSSFVNPFGSRFRPCKLEGSGGRCCLVPVVGMPTSEVHAK